MDRIVIRRDNLMSGEGMLTYRNAPVAEIITKS